MKLFTFKRFFIVTLLMCLGISQGWAGHSNHTGKVTVTSNGNGTVYIGTSDTATSGNTEETWHCDGNSANDSKTFYLFAKPDDGYAFTGWSGSGSSDTSPYRITPNASQNNGTYNYTATFKKINTFSATVSVKAMCDGNEINFGPVTVDGKSESTDSVQNTNDNHTFNFTLSAASGNGSDDDYVFQGWSKDPNATANYISLTRNNQYSVVCNPEVPVTETLYAIYKKKNVFTATVNVLTACDGEVGDFGTVSVTSDNPQTHKELAPNHTFTFSVKAEETNDDYEFQGWSEDKNATSFTSGNTSSNPLWDGYKVECGANAEVTPILYAIFAEKVDLTATVNVDVLYNLGGSVKVYVQGEQEDSKNPTTSVQTIKGYRDHQFKFTIEATASEGYRFVGWRKDAATNTTSTNSKYNVTITCNAQGANKVETYHAVFEATGGVYIRNRETGRFLKSGGNVITVPLSSTKQIPMVVGNYPVKFDMSRQQNNQFRFKASDGSHYLGVYDFLSNNKVCFANITYRKDWTLNEVDGFYEIYNGNNYLTATTTSSLNSNPNYCEVNGANKNNTKAQQWEILTEDDLRAEMTQANAQTPINVSWLMKNPNFDITFNNGWNYTAKSGRINNDIPNGNENNYIGEFFVKECDQDTENCEHSTTWDINQTINKVPNGWYVVTCQAFQRVNEGNQTDPRTDSEIKFYANKESKEVIGLFSLTEGTSGGTTYNGHNYANSMAEASTNFSNGLYKNALKVKVQDGNITIGIKKESQTASQETSWCTFDNFQLYYFGNDEPTDKYDDLDTRHNADFDADGNLVLTGLWRVLDEQELNAEVADKTSEDSPLVIDATNATLIAKPTLPTTANPNTIILTKDANDVTNTQNVVVGNNCANLVLDEKYHFATSELEGVTAADMTVKRSFWSGEWNTFCVPFDMSVNDLQEILGDDNAEVATLYALEDKTLKFQKVESLTAGTPYLVWVNNDSKTFDVELTAENVTMGAADATGPDGATFQGTYDYTDALSTDGNCFVINGNKFYCVNSPVKLKGFRGYFVVPGGLSALSASFDNEEVTGISSVNENEYENDNIYNIAGQRVNATTKGIVIKNGKKFINK